LADSSHHTPSQHFSEMVWTSHIPKKAKKGVCAGFVLQLLNSGRLQRLAINDSSAQRLVAQE